MRFSKRNKYLLFALLTILNIIFRLPVTAHEIGVDSFFIHRLATSISTYGYAGWTVHPVSFTGLYPLSYASAYPFLLSGISQITGISVEYAILLSCILLGIFSVFFTFLFAKEVKNDDLFAFLVAFVFSLSPNFLRFTIWDATTRSLFMALLPLLLWALIKCWKSFSGKYVGIAIVAYVMLICSHRISLYIPLIFVAFIAAVILTFIYLKVKNSQIFSNSKVLNKLSYFIFPVAFLLLFFVQFSGIGFYDKWLPDFYVGYLFEGEETHIVALNIAADYFGKIGIILFFGVIGFFYFPKNVYNDFGKLFVCLSILTLTPFLVMEDYTPEVILPFLSILAVFGLISTYNVTKQRKKMALSILLICLVVSTGFSWYMLDHWNVYKSSMSDKTYATASFLGSEKANGTSVANSGLLSCQISAFSEKSCLPYGGRYAQVNSPEQLIYGSVKPDEVVTQPLSVSAVISNRRLFELISALPNAKNDWDNLLRSHYSTNKILRAKYDIQYAVEDLRLKGKYIHWRTYDSRLLVSLHESGNKIYDNSGVDIWYLN